MQNGTQKGNEIGRDHVVFLGTEIKGAGMGRDTKNVVFLY